MRVWPLFLLGGLLLGASLHAAENDHVQIARENAPAVVAVNVVRADGSTFTGTGFVLTQDGLIATARHVEQDAIYTNVTFNNGTVSGEAQTVATAGNVDLALLKIQALHLPTVRVASSAQVQPGQPITVIGNPRRLQNTISSGLISQVRQKADGIIWHQISAPISPSSSGSPVFNAQGEVISVVFASFPGENNQNLNFSIPSDYLLELVKKAGFTLENTEKEIAVSENSGSPFWNHIKKSWAIVTKPFRRQTALEK